MYEHGPIDEARKQLEECIELIDREPQQSFFLMRLRSDLVTVRDALNAVQTIVVAPLADGIDANVATPPPMQGLHNAVEAVYAGNPPQSLADLDDGEPAAYEVDHTHGTTIIKE